MTQSPVTLPLAQRGQLLVSQLTDNTGNTSESLVANLSAASYGFALSPNTMFQYPLVLNMTLSGLSAPDSFFVVILASPTALPTGVPFATVVPPAQLPAVYTNVPGAATGATIELGRQQVSTNGPVAFNLDLSLLGPFIGTSQSPTGAWNGHLVLWLCATASASSTWTYGSLQAYGVTDYFNRDTGMDGYQSAYSRIGRCPTTGFRRPTEEWVRDGWTNVMVIPEAWDPPEPPPRVFGPEGLLPPES